MAGAGDGWALLEPALRWLEGEPGDHEIALAVAAAAAGLGLRTLAREFYAQLPVDLKRDGRVERLGRGIERLEDDRVDPMRRRAQCEGGVEVLASRGVKVSDALEEWIEREAAREVYRAADGNLVAYECGAGWVWLADRRGDAMREALPFAGAGGAMDAARAPKPVVVEGLNPPWLADRVWRATPRTPDGYAPRLIVVQRSAIELLDGLACMDGRAMLGDTRVEVFVGEDAGARLGEWLGERVELSLPEFVVRTPGTADCTEPSVKDAVRAAHESQQRLHGELVARVHGAYAGKGSAAWRERFAGAAAAEGGGGASGRGGLRVLLPISRYSTFVRHSAEDLARALERMGHTAHVLMEPDDSSKLASTAYLRAFDEVRPDLVVLINYVRAQMGDSIPPGVPFVCWIQDRMPQLFDERLGRSQGELDFLFGHLHPVLRVHYGYPFERALFRYIPASAAKFHDGACDEGLVARLACDVAYVSHQSRPPEALHEEMVRSYAARPEVVRAMEVGRRWVMSVMRGKPTYLGRYERPCSVTMRMTLGILEEAGIRDPDPRMAVAFMSNYVSPFAERMHRHTALEWAGEIARERGLRFHLYGRGWEDHPRLGAFAKGELPHDEALRTAYRSARVHLHISTTTNAHQRIAECALSGGLMLRRGPTPDHDLILTEVRRKLADDGRPLWIGENGVAFYGASSGGGVDIERCARFMHMPIPRSDHEAAGMLPFQVRPEVRKRLKECMPVDLWQLPDYAFARADETIFRDKDELENRIMRAVGDEAWRAETIASHRETALEHMTSDSAARALLGFVAAKLGARG